MIKSEPCSERQQVGSSLQEQCRVFYARSVDTDVSGQGNISPGEDLLRDACVEPTQKKMNKAAPFYIHERMDPTV